MNERIREKGELVHQTLVVLATELAQALAERNQALAEAERLRATLAERRGASRQRQGNAMTSKCKHGYNDECPFCDSRCGQHAGIVRYKGDTCPLCRAHDLLHRARRVVSTHIEATDERCGRSGCSCTYPGMEPCSAHEETLATEIDEFLS